MSAEGFIAGKLRFRERMVVSATALSSFVMILAISISSGFRTEIRKGISELSGDVILSSGDHFAPDDSICRIIMEMPEVKEIRPVVYRPGITREGNIIKGVIFKGIESADSSLHATLPSKLAASLGIETGDMMTAYFPGERMQIRKFTVSGIYDSPVETGENPLVFAKAEDIRRLNSWKNGEVSELEVLLKDDIRSREKIREAAIKIGFIAPYMSIASTERYSRIFDWLDLVDFNVVILLVLMTTVAGFNMISGLLILLFRSTSAIGLLKAVGMGNKSISSVFLRLSARLAASGMAIGNIAALTLSAIQSSTHLIRLNPENYFVSFVPVNIDLPLILGADLVSFAIIMLLLIIPTRFISGVDPAKTVKYE